ncbi:MAG: TVP38/TMEM64 family protein [Planctomycetota bacterium]
MLAAVAVVIVVLAAADGLSWRERLRDLLAWTGSLGPWGPVALPLLYVITCVLFLPSVVLTVGAGFLFGLGTGTLSASIGNVVGASAAYWLARRLARRRVLRLLNGHDKMAVLSKALSRDDFKIVLLSRLSPINPFTLFNYVFGATDVRFGRYALATWLGMLPGTALYVSLGTGLRSLAQVASSQGTEPPAAVLALAVVALLAITAYLAWWAKGELDREVTESCPGS